MLIVLGEPVPWRRAGRDKRSGRTYTPRKVREAEDFIAWAAKGRKVVLQAGPVSLTLRFYLGEGRKGRRPDLDNLVKLVKDALNGVLYRDDSQVSHLEADRFLYDSNPRTEIEWSAHDHP